MFTHIKENQIFYKTYFKLCYDEKHLISVCDPKRAEQEHVVENLKYHIEFFRNGLNAIIKMWLSGGCVESPEEMAEVLKTAHDSGIGIFAMKALGGGHLCATAEEALGFALSKPFIDAVAVGMQSIEEVDANVRFLTSGAFSDTDRERLSKKHRRLHVEEYCEGCGACVKRCGAGALSLAPADTDEESAKYDFSADFITSESIESTAVPKMRAVADDEKCVRCGYCTKVCPVFALKVY